MIRKNAPTVVVLLAALVAAPLAVSCFQRGIAEQYASNREVMPQLLPYERAYLLMVGAVIESEMRAKTTANTVEFDFVSNGTTMDSEKYSFSDDFFAYVGDQGQVFEPGIPLMKYPYRKGDSWKWSGDYRLINSEVQKKATAKVKTQEESINTVLGQFATIKVTVELSIETDQTNPATQKLEFWIAPNKGIIKRDFLYGGGREPMVPGVSTKEP